MTSASDTGDVHQKGTMHEVTTKNVVLSDTKVPIRRSLKHILEETTVLRTLETNPFESAQLVSLPAVVLALTLINGFGLWRQVSDGGATYMGLLKSNTKS